MRAKAPSCAGAIGLLLALAPAGSRASECQRSDFEAVVGQAAEVLRELNGVKRPDFQAQLRQLKEKRGWSHAQFLEAASPFVQDEEIAGFDERTTVTLQKIESMGAEGARANVADCGRLAEVRGHMATLVEVQKLKWDHMFAKLKRELEK